MIPSVHWRTSSYSNSGGANCVEVGPLTDLPTRIAVRDSKDREGPTFLTSPAEWSGFITGIKSGGFDH
ncbi:DUF397 domain-containing protein [Phytomonospora endophytica]|uniref:DUF397 domain-containing protein n=1 Tax=Phytomonospora endophytica TaxID=714109 RepID=A0A841FNV2_9ACTN|nr:DUF397 domain-containing protein [Phytomonospora endophytica]MBB6035478.1 hypothetical protein [Phytomonospora endophytica]GIG63769.1 hypothetical protein Pen01_00640 [Phytomonospora endophytica]